MRPLTAEKRQATDKSCTMEVSSVFKAELRKNAETEANTIVVPANMRGFEMILPTDKLAQQ